MVLLLQEYKGVIYIISWLYLFGKTYSDLKFIAQAHKVAHSCNPIFQETLPGRLPRLTEASLGQITY